MHVRAGPGASGSNMIVFSQKLSKWFVYFTMGDSTPTKTVRRPAAVLPKSKDFISIHCLEIVTNAD